MQVNKLHISTTVALLFHVCGAVGIVCTPYRDWFIQHTPLNLLLMALLLVWNQQDKNPRFFLFLFIAFATGMLTEIAGVQSGLLFGTYSYGTVMGARIGGVPWLIGLNWAVIMICTGSVMAMLLEQVAIKDPGRAMPARLQQFSLVLDAAILAVVFDWIMEPAAVKLGFWQWENGVIPVYNYVCWFAISLLLLFIFSRMRFRKENRFAAHLLIIQALFFLIIRTFM
ncbi:carotenoid biosynthesis protein [Sediminibacterium ginsengisoli]|uniref:Putative membrane protein n=1 Tax=Sediminibacterium ginsengisoli TaxID=413434 RepID=A0A1T4JUZ3_9BACT|nr:carotenoid biosynthesis protein [Sediminibacterium ginsengisoli]SJZ33954.1 putative membrane protein [Sediminibacterium ginsengisoli]